jgi:hypothetical protein
MRSTVEIPVSLGPGGCQSNAPPNSARGSIRFGWREMARHFKRSTSVTELLLVLDDLQRSPAATEHARASAPEHRLWVEVIQVFLELVAESVPGSSFRALTNSNSAAVGGNSSSEWM